MSRRTGVPSARDGVIVGPVRIDSSVRTLARRLQPGDIAVIDVLDLDRAGAEALADAQVAAVLNVQPSISGRYPAGGSSVLAAAGVPLVDRVDGRILTLREGTVATIDFFALEADAPAGTAGGASGKGTKKRKGTGAEPGSDATDDAHDAQEAQDEPASAQPPATDDEQEAGARPAKGIGAWIRERDERRTARKRASMTWLDELREIDDAPASAASSEADPAPDRAASAASEPVATPERPQDGPWRARIEVGGLELTGHVMDGPAIAAALEEAQSGMSTQLAVFTANAMDVVDRSGAALIEGEGLPPAGVELRGKHVVVVAPGFGAAGALRSIRPYLRDHKPVIIAVGEAAEIARKTRCQPHVIIGSTEGLSEQTIARARHVISHAGQGGTADANEARLGALQRSHASSDIAISSEDLALLVAAAGGAKAVVTVGVEASLLDFLESGRVDAAGTFLARLSTGSRLVDARTLAALYRPRWSGVVIVAALILAAAALGAALWANADSRAWIEGVLGAAGVAS